ncbi:hypothetical protein ACQKL5_06205 [Peribacillus sp. NPDC097675]
MKNQPEHEKREHKNISISFFQQIKKEKVSELDKPFLSLGDKLDLK